MDTLKIKSTRLRIYYNGIQEDHWLPPTPQSSTCESQDEEIQGTGRNLQKKKRNLDQILKLRDCTWAEYSGMLNNNFLCEKLVDRLNEVKELADIEKVVVDKEIQDRKDLQKILKRSHCTEADLHCIMRSKTLRESYYKGIKRSQREKKSTQCIGSSAGRNIRHQRTRLQFGRPILIFSTNPTKLPQLISAKATTRNFWIQNLAKGSKTHLHRIFTFYNHITQSCILELKSFQWFTERRQVTASLLRLQMLHLD